MEQRRPYRIDRDELELWKNGFLLSKARHLIEAFEVSSLIKTFWEIGRSNDNDGFILLETIHLDEKLVQGLLHILLVSAASLASNRVQLINEDDSRFLLPCSSKEFTNALGADTHKHFFKVRS